MNRQCKNRIHEKQNMFLFFTKQTSVKKIKKRCIDLVAFSWVQASIQDRSTVFVMKSLSQNLHGKYFYFLLVNLYFMSKSVFHIPFPSLRYFVLRFFFAMWFPVYSIVMFFTYTCTKEVFLFAKMIKNSNSLFFKRIELDRRPYRCLAFF